MPKSIALCLSLSAILAGASAWAGAPVQRPARNAIKVSTATARPMRPAAGPSALATTPTELTMNDAKKAAVAFFRASGVVPATEAVHFQKRNSTEYTPAYLEQTIKYIGEHNRSTPIYRGLLAEMAKDPSLRIYSVFLGTGHGDTATQDVLLVKLRKENGVVKSEVTRD